MPKSNEGAPSSHIEGLYMCLYLFMSICPSLALYGNSFQYVVSYERVFKPHSLYCQSPLVSKENLKWACNHDQLNMAIATLLIVKPDKVGLRLKYFS